MSNQYEVAIFGGGCFWCTEAIFQEVRGVVSVESGYAGGYLKSPTYEKVSQGKTGHAEVIKITFNPQVISYRDLLDIFFSVHDPTTMNRQGNDVGPQYRSIIVATSDKQQATATDAIASTLEQKHFSGLITTEVIRSDTFYPAESYHQNYYRENKEQPYCQIVISPKLEKFRKTYKQLLSKSPFP